MNLLLEKRTRVKTEQKNR